MRGGGGRGDKVTFWWPSANRDPEVFRRAGRVRHPPRPQPAHGRTRAPGAEFGRLQLWLVLTALLDRVAAITPAGPVAHAPNNEHTVLLDVPVRLVPTV